MDLDKAYNMVDRKVFRRVLRLYRVGLGLLRAVQNLFLATVRLVPTGEISEVNASV